jgi:hypothetical protein
MQSPIPTVPTIAAIASRLERLARILAPLLCWAVAAALTLAECCYQCGYQLGRAVHERNDQLSALWCRLCRIPSPATVPSPAQPATAPVVPALHPLAELAASLESLTVAELRRMTGTRRKCRKAELISLALVMA